MRVRGSSSSPLSMGYSQGRIPGMLREAAAGRAPRQSPSVLWFPSWPFSAVPLEAR